MKPVFFEGMTSSRTVSALEHEGGKASAPPAVVTPPQAPWPMNAGAGFRPNKWHAVEQVSAALAFFFLKPGRPAQLRSVTAHSCAPSDVAHLQQEKYVSGRGTLSQAGSGAGAVLSSHAPSRFSPVDLPQSKQIDLHFAAAGDRSPEPGRNFRAC
jgi:hypothetical protein